MARHYSSTAATPGCSGAFSGARLRGAGRIPVSCPPGFQGRYTVVSGDTMFLIAKRFGVTLDALIAANPHITNPSMIYPGDILCVPGPPPVGRVPVSCPPGFQGRYTVVSGDTMFLIAKRFGVTLDALIAANPHITNPSMIYPGDILCVPGPPPVGRVPVSCPPGFQGRYTVVSGDTMFLIAKRFGVTLDALIAANPHITNPSMIYPGDILCVPGPPPVGRVPVSCPPGFQGRYTVVSGDTMFLIAKRFGVTLDALIAANPHITDPNVLFPCDVLCVPCPRPGRVPVSCPPGFQGQYTVQPGDTMFLIAQRFRVTLDALISANPHISDPNLILPCDVLCIPCPLPADALPPPEEPRFPCCVVLKALPPPHPDCAPGGTAFVQLLPNKQNSVSILAVRLPEPATRGDFDAYQGIIESPGAPKVTFPLQLCQPDPSLWAGMVEALPKLSFATRVSVCPVDSETGETGKAVLAASLQRCT